jgi:hypothetical protein
MSNIWRKFTPILNPSREQGYILPLVLVLGSGMLLLALTAALAVQMDRKIGSLRRQNADGLATVEGGTERLLLELSRQNNAMLLGRNYDPINPATNRSYLGADGVRDSGDEVTTAVNEWTGYNPSNTPCFQQASIAPPSMPLTGTLSSGGTYTLLAYRYNSTTKKGTLLVEGRAPNQAPERLEVTIAVSVPAVNFPGILSTTFTPTAPEGSVALRGRVAMGKNANVYFPPNSSGNPSFTGSAAPGSTNRAAYLNSIWAGPSDDVTGDTIQGSLQACQIYTNLPFTPPAGATDLRNINNSETLTGAPNQITHYLVEAINLKQTRTLTVDTTQGPVYLYVDKEIELQDSSRILNVRTDGKAPRVGDLRIFMLNPDTGGKDKNSVVLEDTSCIQDVFLYAPGDDLELLTTGPGCPSGRNTNFEGVVWAEMIVATRQSKQARDVPDPRGKIKKSTKKEIPGATSGIYVPDDVSSLSDILPYITLPVRYQFGGFHAWRQTR